MGYYFRALYLCPLLIALWISPIARAADGDYLSAVRMGGSMGVDDGHSITTDLQGNVITTGFFRRTVDFDPGPGTLDLVDHGDFDVFVQKLNRFGALVWAKGIGGEGSDYGNCVTTDTAGNVYITGDFSDIADFDPAFATEFNMESAGYLDVFVMKLYANGEFAWAVSMGGISIDAGKSIAVDAEGNVFTAGEFYNTVDFDPGPGTYFLSSGSSAAGFLQKLDNNGNFIWAVKLAGGSDASMSGVVVDGEGAAYLAGSFGGTASFSPSVPAASLTSAGASDAFAAKLDASGNVVWARHLGGTEWDEGVSIALDSQGNVFCAGTYAGTADFDPGDGVVELSSAGADDVFLCKLNDAGNFLWARSMGGSSTEFMRAIAIDRTDSVYSTGIFQGTADFDPGAGTLNLTSAGFYEIFLSKLDTNGDLVYAHRFGGGQDDEGYGVAVDGGGNLYATGFFRSVVDFDPGSGVANLTSAGSDDIFVLKLAGPPDTEAPNAIRITPSTTGPTGASSVTFEVEFDEDVLNFAFASQVEIVHDGTAHTGVTISGGGTLFEVTVNGISGQGEFTLAIKLGQFIFDYAANNLASSVTSVPVLIDAVAPSVSMSSTAPSLTNAAPIPVSVTFSKPVTGFEIGGITPANATVSNFAGSGADYTFNLTPIADGTVSADIAAGVASDSAGNLNLAAPQFSRTFDGTSPSVTVEQAPAQSDPTQTAPVYFRITFSEPVSGLGAGDITFQGSATIGGLLVSGSGSNYLLRIAEVSGAGTVRPVVQANAVVDQAGNSNTASTSTDNSVTFNIPAISVVPGSGSFGGVAVGQCLTRLFRVENTGSGTLSGNVNVLAPFNIEGSSSYALAAGATAEITVRFCPTAVAPYSRNVSFGGGGGAMAPVTGQGLQPAQLQVSPAARDFGTVGVGSCGSRAYKVENTGGVPLSGNAVVPAPFSVVSNASYTLAPGAFTWVYVDFCPASAGAVTRNVTFTGGGGATTTATGSGQLVPIIEVAPASRDFGETPLGSCATKAFRVSNTGSALLAGSVSVAAPFSIAGDASYELAPGAFTWRYVNFCPAVEAPIQRTVSFTGGGGATTAVTGSGQVAPQIEVLPASRDFGSVAVGGCVTKAFKVTNTGSALLEGTATVGAPFSISSGANYSLASGASAWVYVNFCPSAAGPAAASVSFTGGSGATTNVSGSGVLAPLIQISPSSRDFGTVLVGGCATRAFRVTNTGSALLQGAASVSAPFSISGSASYSLAPGAGVWVYLEFCPTQSGPQSQPVNFTGGGGGSATALGQGTAGAPG